MDFATTDHDRAILDKVDRFARRRLSPSEVRRRDAARIPPYDLLPEMAELGLFALPLPAAYGGLDARWTTIALVQELLGGRAYFAASIYNRMIGFGAMSLLAFGSEEQKRRLLPELAAGRLVFALAATEATAGSDAAGLETRATEVEDGWLLRGRKLWVSDAAHASYLLVTARRPGTSRAEGVSLFMAPPSSAGLVLTPLEKIGNNCMPTYEVAFEDVFVPADGLIGETDQGFANLKSILHFSRASMAATVVGCAQAAVELAITHAKERRQFGRSNASFQTIRFRLVDMQMRVDQARLVVRHLAWLISERKECAREAAQAKIIATEALQYVTNHGMQIMGAAGYAEDGDMQRYWRDARLYSIGEGSNEIQRELVARRLGL